LGGVGGGLGGGGGSTGGGVGVEDALDWLEDWLSFDCELVVPAFEVVALVLAMLPPPQPVSINNPPAKSERAERGATFLEKNRNARGVSFILN
jgi:hypothetical protein